MRYEFGEFCLNARCRTLTLRSRELVLQPKAFDLLHHLVAHRDRVVNRRELLEVLWPDVVVSDGSLKRAVSLVRSALREGEAEDAIQTYQRRGYRFCRPVTETGAPDRPTPPEERATKAPDAGLSASEREHAGRRAHHAAEPHVAIGALQRAVALFAVAEDQAGAARCALRLAQVHFEQRELTVGRGWLLRAASYLGDSQDTAEHGHHAWLSSRFAVAEGNIAEGVRLAERAQAIGKARNDENLQALGLLYKGLALVAQGEVRSGCAHHDEAAATVLSAAVEPWVGGLVYCGIIFTCRNRADWRRASEWTARFMELCSDADLASFPGTCRLHRAELLQVGGALAEAEQETSAVCKELARTAPWAEGDAYQLLGDVRLARGAWEDAERAYLRAHELGWDPQPGLALLRMAQGRPQAGVRALLHSLAAEDWCNRQRRGLLLTHLVPVALAAGEPERAREAIAELERAPELWQTAALSGAVAEAKGLLARHDGAPTAALAHLQRALRLYQEAGSPLNAARTRIERAEILRDQDDADGAELELSAATRVLSGLGAAPLEARLVRVRETVPRA